MKKQLISMSFVIPLVLLCAGCIRQEHVSSSKRIDWSISKHSNQTGLDYEENSSGYKAALLSFEDKEFIIDYVQDWASEKTAANTFRSYISTDPDSWEMYVYHTNEDADGKCYNMKFYIEDSTVKLYLTTADPVDDEQRASYFLVLIQAPPRGAWPVKAEVYVDNVELENHAIS